MRSIAATILLPMLLVIGTSAGAALQGRDLDRSRAGYEAYYDTVRNVTWLADADYAYTSGRSTNGKLSFAEALSWAEQLELYGVRGWRLPVVRPLDANGCVAGHVSVFCGVPIAAQPSELWDLMHDSLALESIYQSGPLPNLQDYRNAAAGAERLQIPGRDGGVSFANVMSSYWLAGLRRESSECPPGSTCDQGAEPMPVPVGGYWSPDGQSFSRCLFASQCAAVAQPGSAVRGYPDLPNGSAFTGVESVWPWQIDMLTDFQTYVGESSATANVWLVRTGDVSPVPEPAMWCMMLGGIGLLCARGGAAVRAETRAGGMPSQAML